MVTASGVVLFSGKRSDAVEAFCVMVSAYYIYNLSYDIKAKRGTTEKEKKETRNLMDFIFM